MATREAVVEASDIAEDVVELVEDTAEFVGDRVSWLKTTNAKLFLVGVSALAIGATVSYVISAKRLSKKYQALADEQIADVKLHYTTFRKEGVDLDELADKYNVEEADLDVVVDPADLTTVEEITQREGYVAYDKVKSTVSAPSTQSELVVNEEVIEAEVVEVETNVFDSDGIDTEFDMARELERRAENPGKPFVISKEEFEEGTETTDQSTLTYFDGDDVLTDAQDGVIREIDKVVGVENLNRFGHGSEDPEIVYIRNFELGLDFEVVHSDGLYTKVVLGIDSDTDSLQHSYSRGRRSRQTDE